MPPDVDLYTNDLLTNYSIQVAIYIRIGMLINLQMEPNKCDRFFFFILLKPITQLHQPLYFRNKILFTWLAKIFRYIVRLLKVFEAFYRKS